MNSKLPQALQHIQEIAKKYGFGIGNIFHAGDGNLHPIVLYDPGNVKAFGKAIAASEEIIRYCVGPGGVLAGEHGVGMEKNDLMTLTFSKADFDLMRRVHDAFNPCSSVESWQGFPAEQRLRRNPCQSKRDDG